MATLILTLTMTPHASHPVTHGQPIACALRRGTSASARPWGRAHVEGAVVGRVDALEPAQHLREGCQAGVQLRELRPPPLAVAPPLRCVADAAVRELLLDLRPAPVSARHMHGGGRRTS